MVGIVTTWKLPAKSSRPPSRGRWLYVEVETTDSDAVYNDDLNEFHRLPATVTQSDDPARPFTLAVYDEDFSRLDSVNFTGPEFDWTGENGDLDLLMQSLQMYFSGDVVNVVLLDDSAQFTEE